MLQRFNHRAGHYALLLTAGAALFLVNLGGASLWDADEGLNATAAYEMRESGEYVVPKFNAELRSHKPALLYWLQVAAYSVFGVNEFAARLPSALAALLSLLLAYELGRSLFGAATGLLAGLILGSTAMFCASGHFANPDALLNVSVLLTLFIFWQGFAHSGRWWFVPAGAAAGLAVLAKGPSGLALPFAVVVLFLAWSRRLKLLLDRRLLLGILAFVLVALPWYAWVGVETKGQFLKEFLFTHNFERALRPMENHQGPFWYYLAVLLVGFAPWSVFLSLACWHGFRAALGRPGSADTDDEAGSLPRTAAYRFLWCWLGVYLLTFSLVSTKLPNYILPVAAPTALLVARFLDRWRTGRVQVPRWLMGLCLVMLALVGLLTAFGLLMVGGAFHLPLMRDRYCPGIEVWAAVGAAPVLGALAAAWCVRRQRRTGLVVALTLASVGFIAPLAAWGSAAFNRYKAPRPLVEMAGAFRRDLDIRIGCSDLEYLPSLNFYCQRNVQRLRTVEDVRGFLRHPGPDPVFLFIPESLWTMLSGQVGDCGRVIARHREMYRGCDVLVVSNR